MRLSRAIARISSRGIAAIGAGSFGWEEWGQNVEESTPNWSDHLFLGVVADRLCCENAKSFLPVLAVTALFDQVP